MSSNRRSTRSNPNSPDAKAKISKLKDDTSEDDDDDIKVVCVKDLPPTNDTDSSEYSESELEEDELDEEMDDYEIEELSKYIPRIDVHAQKSKKDDIPTPHTSTFNPNCNLKDSGCSMKRRGQRNPFMNFDFDDGSDNGEDCPEELSRWKNLFDSSMKKQKQNLKEDFLTATLKPSPLNPRDFAVHLAMKYIKDTQAETFQTQSEPNLFPNLVGSISNLTSILYQIVEIQLQAKNEIQRAKRLSIIKEEMKKPESHKCSFKAVLTRPYFKDKLGNDRMVAPVLDPNAQLPFRIRFPRIFREKELDRLKLSVHRSYFQHKAFLVESRFSQLLLKIGFHSEDILNAEIYRKNLEKDLWGLECQKRHISAKDFASKRKKLITRYETNEIQMFNEFLSGKKETLKPLVVSTNEPSGTMAFIKVTDLIHWRLQEMSLLYNCRAEFNQNVEEIALVDWLLVSKDMTSFTRRNISEDVCERTYKICTDPRQNYEPETVPEIRKLKELTKLKKNRDWSLIATKLKTNRTPIRVFDSYRKYINKNIPFFLNVPEYKNKAALLLPSCEGNLTKVAEIMSHKYQQEVSDKQIRNHWRNLNPSFARGSFFLEEDALLLVSMELLKEKIVSQGFKAVSRILPWRYGTVWKYRASKLFHNRSSTWSIDEDRLLLKLVEQYGPQWGIFQQILRNKSRDSCMARHKRLLEKLKFMTLEEYHVVYKNKQQERYSVMDHLKKVIFILKEIIQEKISVSSKKKEHNIEFNDPPTTESQGHKGMELLPMTNVQIPICDDFILDITRNTPEQMELDDDGLSEEVETAKKLWDLNALKVVESQDLKQEQALLSLHQMDFVWKPPNQIKSREYLKTFRLPLLKTTCQKLTEYLENRNQPLIITLKKETYSDGTYSNVENEQPTIDVLDEVKKRPVPLLCDRRKFVRENAMSMASALHLRGVSLVKVENDEKLTPWQKEVYSFYRIFSGGNRIKPKSYRAGVPSALELALLPELQTIIIHPKELKLIKPEDTLHPEKCRNEAVFYENLGPNGFIPLTKDIVEAKQRFENRGTGIHPWKGGRSTRSKLRQKKVDAANIRWIRKKEREQLEAMKEREYQEVCSKSKVPEPIFEIVFPEIPPTPAEKMILILHDHNYIENYKELSCKLKEKIQQNKDD